MNIGEKYGVLGRVWSLASNRLGGDSAFIAFARVTLGKEQSAPINNNGTVCTEFTRR
jgi:hypothetical protein